MVDSIFCVRWLIKNDKEDKALKYFNRIYKDKETAEKKITDIKLSLSSNTKSLYKTVKFILQWKVLQRFVPIMVTLLLLAELNVFFALICV